MNNFEAKVIEDGPFKGREADKWFLPGPYTNYIHKGKKLSMKDLKKLALMAGVKIVDSNRATPEMIKALSAPEKVLPKVEREVVKVAPKKSVESDKKLAEENAILKNEADVNKQRAEQAEKELAELKKGSKDK